MMVCASCGHGNVSRAQWVDINGHGVIEDCGKPLWCWDCASDTEAIEAHEYQRQQREYEADFAADCARDDAMERGR